jgi:hypothetical protein
MLTSRAKLPFGPGWCYHPRQKEPHLSQVVTPPRTKGRKFACRGILREIPHLSRVVARPMTQGVPLVSVGNTTRDKRLGSI